MAHFNAVYNDDDHYALHTNISRSVGHPLPPVKADYILYH